MTTTPVSRNREFLKLWVSFTVARFGGQVTILALPLTAVLLLGAGPAETGLLVAAQMAPSLLLGLFIGVWVDRLPRLPIIFTAQIGAAIVIASIPAAAFIGILSLAQLYAVAFLLGVAASSIDLARSALVPSIVTREQLVAANSRLQASDAVSRVAGPPVGGILVQLFTAPIAMAVDAAMVLVAAAVTSTIRVREAVRERTDGRSVWREIGDGLDWMRRHEVLFRSITAIALANIEWFAVEAILVVYATRELHLSPAVLGLALGAIGPVSFVGATVAGRLTAWWGLGPVMIASLLLETVSRLLLPFAGGSELQAAAVVATSQAILGLTVPLWTISAASLQQAVTPPHLLGRVSAATRFVAFGVAPPAAFGAGLLADLIGLRATLFISAVIAAAAFVYLLASPVRVFRHVEPAPEAA